MVPGARLIVLGKQGAGKGTQCVRLSRHYVIPHISTGDMLRAAVKRGTEIGEEARRYMDAGELVPDEVLLKLVDNRLDQDDTKARGFVLDGFPRTVRQADMLDEILPAPGIDLVLNLVVPTNLVLRRLSARRTCVDCGANYSLSAPPAIDWTCDICGGEVVQREDDTEAAIKRRLDLYERQTAPLVARYRRLGLIATVRGDAAVDAVTDRLVKAIDGRRQPRAEGRP